MKLNHEEFVALLARALELDEKEASEALNTWVDAVTREMEENGSCEVEVLGTFRKAEDGSMEFSPNDILALEVNYKFAGLSPIEVSPPTSDPDTATGGAEDKTPTEADATEKDEDEREEAEADNEADTAGEKRTPEEESADADSSDDPFGIDGYRPSGEQDEEEYDEDGQVDDHPEEPDEELEPGTERDRQRREEDPGPEQQDPDLESTEEWDERREDEEPVVGEDEAKSEWEPDYEPEPEDEPDYEPEREPEPEPELADSEQGEEQDRSGSYGMPKLSLSQKLKPRGGASKNRRRSVSDKIAWLIPIAALLIVAVLLFFHFDGLRLSRTHIDDQPVVRQEMPVPAPRDDREQEEAVQEFVPSPDPVEDVVPPPDMDLAPERVDDVGAEPADDLIRDMALPYGLKGPEDEVLIGSYTIVVHSLRNERKSEIEKQRLEAQGFKATQWSAVLPSGNTTYRVGIGQFQSVSDAERAVEELPEPFRSNNFIIRIR